MKLELDDLTKLVDDTNKRLDDHAFIYKDVDHPAGGDSYRIFNYRFASIKDFSLDSRLSWCRGTMFNLRTKRIVSRPMEKFFNLHEITNNDESLYPSDRWLISDKHDGSLVSTYLHSDGNIYLKSKNSLESTQAIRATEQFNEHIENFVCNTLDEMKELLSSRTVNYEYVAPDNMIVLYYEEPVLKFLNTIVNSSGEYVKIDYKGIISNSDLDEFSEKTYKDKSPIEGYIVTSKDLKSRFKLKTRAYCVKHRLNDALTTDRLMLELVVSNDLDDIIDSEMKENNHKFVEMLEERYNSFKKIINGVLKTNEDFYLENKQLTKKEYAIKARSSIDICLHLAMNNYYRRETDLFRYFNKNIKLFGV